MKIPRLGALMLASALATSAWARDITTTTGEVYHNAVVTDVRADGIRFVHDDGAGFLNFQILKEAERKEFGFDPIAYAAAEKDQARIDKLKEEIRLLAAQKALVAAKEAQAAMAAAGPYAGQAPSNWPATPWPTTMDVGYQTPAYAAYDSAGWLTWPTVPSTYYYSNPGFWNYGNGFSRGFGSKMFSGRSGGSISFSVGAGHR